jgi:hypothetical protein
MVENGSSDNCSVETLGLSKTSFACNDTGDNTITLTATDASGNTGQCEATVTVLDTISPVAVCKDLTVYLDSNGSAVIDSSLVENGSSDNCSVETLGLSKTSFGCSDTGDNTITLTATDANGNITSCISIVTVIDNLAPVIENVDDISVTLDPGMCEAQIDYPEIEVTDNCKVTLELMSGFGQSGLFPIGISTETWKAKDNSGNADTLSFNITVTASNALPTIDEINDLQVQEDTYLATVHLSGIGYGNDCEVQEVKVSAFIANREVADSVSVEYSEGDSTGIIELLMVPGMSGTTEIKVTVEDSEGGIITETFMLTVTPQNDAPFLVTPLADLAVNAGYVLKVPLSLVPGVIFDDLDDDILTIDVWEEGTDLLPNWAVKLGDTLVCQPAIADTGYVTLIIRATDAGGLWATDTVTIFIDGYPVGINASHDGLWELKMYPNPTIGKVNLEMSSGIFDVHLSVTDVTGKEVLRKQYSASENITFDMSDKVSGIYFVNILVDGNRIVKKLILRK